MRYIVKPETSVLPFGLVHVLSNYISNLAPSGPVYYGQNPNEWVAVTTNLRRAS